MNSKVALSARIITANGGLNHRGFFGGVGCLKAGEWLGD